MTYEELHRKALAAWNDFVDPDKVRILIGTGTCGRAAGAETLLPVIRGFLAEKKIDAEICETGCLGLCYAEPLVELRTKGQPRVLYGGLTANNVSESLNDYFVKHKPANTEALATMGGGSIDGLPAFAELPMMRGQVRIVSRNFGRIDPENIHHYIACNGYAGLRNALKLAAEGVIEEVKSSGLRGRGGAGFPTGKKWEFCRNAPGDTKYMICNADEGDPGAFMDRSVIESDPHAVLEGMAIAAYAIGASEGYIYARAEYPLAIARMEKAIEEALKVGFLGDNILGSGFSFHLKIKKGAGAFVCGEETALIASIEGRRGMPRPRPPFPAQSGLFGRPSNINNVETLANVPVILEKGSKWFSRHGTEKNRGTKTFALAGKIVRTGLIEVPLGTTVYDIVFSIGGGIPKEKRIKAVQTGGPSGGCIPAGLLDIPVDYEKLAEAGAIMGSGGMVVMDEDTCMVDIARYFVEFTQSESCGKCVPCRLGTKQMLNTLDRITAGQGKPEDIELLLEIASCVKQGALCGLGQTAPNPVLTTIRYFRDEYEAHIRQKKCPAAVCRGLVNAACTHTCPCGIDVPRYIRCIADGRYRDALDVVREKIPFPAVCGYICFHPCEKKCRRGQLDAPIAVRALKRFAVEHGVSKRRRRSPRADPTGKRVAIVGAGPAGLTAAYYLGKCGHKVTVFDRNAEPGGTLRSGIPAFRLPRDVIDGEIEALRKDAGVRIRTNCEVGAIGELLKKGYDAALLAHGAQKGLKMGIAGEDSSGVFDCIGFLGRVNSGKRIDLGRTVAVIGGGNAAMDAARAAVRCGAGEVTVVYRRTRKDMPSGKEEIEEALEEGVKIECLAAPTRIEQKNGSLVLHCIRMREGAIDAGGRARPVPVEGSDFEKEVDSTIMAIGQIPETIQEPGCNVDRHGRIVADADSLETSMPGVFAAGDVVTGPASVIEAIAGGRQGARSIDRFLGGDGNIDEILAPLEDAVMGEVSEDQVAHPRTEIPKRSVTDRLADGGPVELSYSKDAAALEAGRCLRCDLEEED